MANKLSTPGFERLPGRRYKDLSTGEIISRREMDKRLSKEGYEAKAARNKRENPELQQQRPARGRKSTLPKKPKSKLKGVKPGGRAKKEIGKNAVYYHKRYNEPFDWSGMREWLLSRIRPKSKRTNDKFRFIGIYEFTTGETTERPMGINIALNKTNINIVIDALRSSNAPAIVGASRDNLIEILVIVTYPNV